MMMTRLFPVAYHPASYPNDAMADYTDIYDGSSSSSIVHHEVQSHHQQRYPPVLCDAAPCVTEGYATYSSIPYTYIK